MQILIGGKIVLLLLVVLLAGSGKINSSYDKRTINMHMYVYTCLFVIKGMCCFCRIPCNKSIASVIKINLILLLRLSSYIYFVCLNSLVYKLRVQNCSHGFLNNTISFVSAIYCSKKITYRMRLYTLRFSVHSFDSDPFYIFLIRYQFPQYFSTFFLMS